MLEAGGPHEIRLEAGGFTGSEELFRIRSLAT
jgi:hypothetical protein